MALFHGIQVTESSDAARALTTVATAVIGLVATAPDADAAAFPLDRPVLVTDLDTAMGKAGASGTLLGALLAISDQVATPVVVVRVAPGADANATSAAVIGGDVNGAKTGMQALLAAEAQLGVRPRILGCPGLDTQAVTTALVVVAQKLRGMAYCAAIGADVTAAVAYAGQFAARELMLIWPDFIAFDTSSAVNVTSFGTARALGLRALIDQTQGWNKTISNVAVEGVLGITKDVHWDLQSAGTDAALLNAANITACVHADGYRFWGNRTCSDDPQFAFESATRTAQVLRDTIAGGLLWAIDKPLRPSLVKDIVDTINAEFRLLKSQGLIIGANATFNPAKNTTSVLSGGGCYIDYDFTPTPPLEQLGITQTITDSYFADFANQLSASAS
jgi:hypothetical protein